MADGTSDDVYDDPDNILADANVTVDGTVELPGGQADDLTQSVYLPEKDTGIPGEGRGEIDELGIHNDPEAGHLDESDEGFTDVDGESGQGGEDAGEDVDSDRLAGQIPVDERDGADPV